MQSVTSFTELASSRLACLLGHRSQEPRHRPFTVRYEHPSIKGLHPDTRLGSFLDGGANHPCVGYYTVTPHLMLLTGCSSLPSRFSSLAELLSKRSFSAPFPSILCVINAPMQEALQRHFKTKRDHVLKRLHEMHLDVDIPPTSTFYIWLNLEKLPAPLNNGLVRVRFSSFFSDWC